jgi:hypothetical protein
MTKRFFLTPPVQVVMPFKYKHHFYLPKRYMWSLIDKHTQKSTEALWDDKKPAVSERVTPFAFFS